MGATTLILAASLLPLIWGWIVYWLVEKLWPQDRDSGVLEAGGHVENPPIDYQI